MIEQIIYFTIALIVYAFVIIVGSTILCACFDWILEKDSTLKSKLIEKFKMAIRLFKRIY